MHYYDEDSISVGNQSVGQVVINHHVELTATEIAEAKQQAKDKVMNEEAARLRKKKPKRKTSTQVVKESLSKTEQSSMFANETENKAT